MYLDIEEVRKHFKDGVSAEMQELAQKIIEDHEFETEEDYGYVGYIEFAFRRSTSYYFVVACDGGNAVVVMDEDISSGYEQPQWWEATEAMFNHDKTTSRRYVS